VSAVFTIKIGLDWRQVDEQRRGVLPTLPHLRHPVRAETERRTAIRQKASVQAESSTITNKRLYFNEFEFLDSDTIRTT